jgi:hypothetical protein
MIDYKDEEKKVAMEDVDKVRREYKKGFMDPFRYVAKLEMLAIKNKSKNLKK